MKFAADFHIHSRYSRATSKEMNIISLDKWSRIKGINVLGTGDFTHPLWMKELKENLEPAELGLYKLKNSDSPTRFILTVEISSIYSKGGKTRRIHNLIFAPSFEIADKINVHLGWIGNLKSDGRPILGLDAKELAKIVLNTSFECLIIPAHCWTPWFSIFGSKSGFDSIEECFEEYSKYIYAIETGLSSDPAMNWRLSKLDKIALISNSDSHSPSRIGREANVLDTELSYKGIVEAIKERSESSDEPKKFVSTVEFFPEEGRYHYDGHRNCEVCFTPEQSKKHNNICPKCGRPLTLGVVYRVDELADRNFGEKPSTAPPFKNLIPLDQIIGDALGIGVKSKGVEKEYTRLIAVFGNELKILLEVNEAELQSVTLPKIAKGIIKVRQGKVNIEPGYDGEYGKISIFKEDEKGDASGQKSLF